MNVVDNYLFNEQWTQGSLVAIAPVVSFLGYIAMIIISIGGFFMVILPIVRNVFNGIVVVAPNLCEKINQAHRTKLGLNQVEGGNQIEMITGSLITVLLSLCPNFIALSDFEEGVRDPKSYMIKAIPMMCIYVFIGVFIFYGYPSKFAEKFSVAATSVIDMALNNVDPKALVDKIPTNLARPDFATGEATDVYGQNVNKVSKSVYSAITSKYSSMSADNKVEVSHQIEGYVDTMMSQILTHSESKDFKLSVETRISGYDPHTNPKAIWPSPAYDDKEHIYVYQFKDVISNCFTVGIPGGTEGDHFMVTLKFYELPDEGDEITNVQCIATVATSGENGFKDSDDDKCTWKTPAGAFAIRDGCMINGVKASKVDEYPGAKSYYEVTFPVDLETLKSSSGQTSGIFVIDPNNVGRQHTVTKVEFGGSYSFTPVDTAVYNSWGLGESPTFKQGSSTGTDSDETENESGRVSDDD